MAEFMTKDELKILLWNFRDMQVQVEFWKKNGTGESLLCDKIMEIEKTVELLDTALKVLNTRERFIIESHLILQYTWPETVVRMTNHFGVNNSRSERTLKRIQSQALEKLLNFIKKVGEY